MLTNLTSAGLALALPPAPPVSPPLVSPVASASQSAQPKLEQQLSQQGGLHDPKVVNLARAARNYAVLLELTADPNLAALFSGFGGRIAHRIDVYA